MGRNGQGSVFHASVWARPAVALNLTAVLLKGYDAEHVNSPLLVSLSRRLSFCSVNRGKTQHLTEGVLFSSAALILLYHEIEIETMRQIVCKQKAPPWMILEDPVKFLNCFLTDGVRAIPGNCEQSSYHFTKQSPRTKPLLGAPHFHAHNTPNEQELFSPSYR